MANVTYSDNLFTGLDNVVLNNGSINKAVTLSEDNRQSQYRLSCNVKALSGTKNYVLLHALYEDGTYSTFFFPISYLGEQAIDFSVSMDVTSFDITLYGNMALRDVSLAAIIDDVLTEEEKLALNKVQTNSEYWDRILAITNSLGNVITNKLEGSINTALNTITGASGKMYWEDGKFICRDAETDAASTMAMMLSPAGFMIADSKLDNGSWDWRTFGTGKGFVADEIISGTLSAITIKGVQITASTLTGGTIVGATIKGGSLNINDRFIVDSEGDVQMSGAVTWGADNSPVKVKYSSDNENYHYNYADGDMFAKYSYDGGLSWTNGIKIQGSDGLPGAKGDTGATGPQGPPGPAGSNANVPNYIQSTKITGTSIESCTITGNTINGSTVNGSVVRGGDVLIGANIPVNPASDLESFTGTYIKSNGSVNGYNKGKNTYILTHAAQGRLSLGRDLGTYGTARIVIDSDQTAITGRNGPEGLILAYDVVGGGNQITICNGNIYIVAGNGRGTVHINGDLEVSGQIYN